MSTMEDNSPNYDNLKATELRLGLPGTEAAPRGCKRMLSECSNDEYRSKSKSSSGIESAGNDKEATPVSKVQVVGWPPVRSYRKNNFPMRKTESESAGGMFVKVSMEGAPYLRKIDLKMYKGYKELKEALEDMFKCFTLGEYAVTYEDKDGDLMLVGDVPWDMFISSCKKLRIMRGNEARGLASTS